MVSKGLVHPGSDVVQVPVPTAQVAGAIVGQTGARTEAACASGGVYGPILPHVPMLHDDEAL